MLKGIDVSAVQGKIDWPWVAAQGARFAIVKGVEGNRPAPDPMFAANVAGARAAGLVVGAYNFAYPLPSLATEPLRDPVAQAHHHFSLSGGLGLQPGDLPPALDLEWPDPAAWGKWSVTATQIRQWALDYLECAESLWGVLPIVYTYPFFATAISSDREPRFARYPLWMASYARPTGWPADTDRPPVIARPWASWTLWQCAGGTALKLSNGSPVDTDVLNGGEAEIKALCSRSTAPLPPLAIAPILEIDQPTPPGDLPPPVA